MGNLELMVDDLSGVAARALAVLSPNEIEGIPGRLGVERNELILGILLVGVIAVQARKGEAAHHDESQVLAFVRGERILAIGSRKPRNMAHAAEMNWLPLPYDDM